MSQDARYDDEVATQRRAMILGLDYIDTSKITNKVIYKEILSPSRVQELRVVPIKADRNHILFGVTNTTSQHTINWLKSTFLDQRVGIALISDSGYREYYSLYNPPPKVEYKEIDIAKTSPKNLISEISNILNQVKAEDMLAYLVQQAHRLGASDIHIETHKDSVRIRFRIDGVLHSIANINRDKYLVLLGAIASAGNISTSSQEAQQGHISEQVTMADGSKVNVNLRLETAKTINAMDIVMRLFNMDESMYNLDKLGLTQSERKIVDDVISRPSGLVMIVGPTGSGKTTTLYSMLKSLSSDEKKIITIEDPVEYQFSDFTQINIKTSERSKDSIFADQLRAVLRLDPDIIMVGEIRDMDTARTALQAAMTGHLVLSTFHANTSAAAITRLADIINQNPLYISAIRLVMAQRLARRLDDKTKQAYTPEPREIASLRNIIESLPQGVDKPDLTDLKIYKASPTEDNPYGYKGQIAIREQFTLSEPIIKILTNKDETVTTQKIEEAAISSGMTTMLQDAALKVIEGLTTLEELYRVIG